MGEPERCAAASPVHTDASRPGPGTRSVKRSVVGAGVSDARPAAFMAKGRSMRAKPWETARTRPIGWAGDRGLFANAELEAFAGRVQAERAAAGLQARITDSDAIGRIAALVASAYVHGPANSRRGRRQ